MSSRSCLLFLLGSYPCQFLFAFAVAVFLLPPFVEVPLGGLNVSEFLAFCPFEAPHLSITVRKAVVYARDTAPTDCVDSFFVDFLAGKPATGLGFRFEFSSFGTGIPIQLGFVLTDVVINTWCVTHTHRVDCCHILSSWLRFIRFFRGLRS